MTPKFLRLYLLLTFLITLPLKAQVDYTLSLEQPEHHLAKIQMQLTASEDLLTVKMPAWRTGKYKLLNQANGIRHFDAKNEKGEVLSWRRTDKSSWQINTTKGHKVSISYQLYANELATRSRHIDSTHGYLDGAAVFMYSPGSMQQVHQIKLVVPSDWKSYSGMSQTGEHTFLANNYHQLASSPIETGINQLSKFSVDGINYRLVIWGQGNYDLSKMTDDLSQLVSQAKTIWPSAPFKDYLFIVHATSGASGATEHINSTVIQKHRYSFAKRKDYLSFLRTAAHEFIHSWNVKAYRPDGLVPYDYQGENYSKLLWVAEGSTSYFQDRLLLTAGLQTVKEYLKSLAKRIDSFKQKPGTQIQSVAEASYEQWIAKTGDFATNHSVNIYSEGFMASWLFDSQLLQDSNLKVGYKDLHTKLYKQGDYNSETYRAFMALPYNSETLVRLAHSMTKQNYQSWWQQNIESPLKVDFAELLELAGLEFAELGTNGKKLWTGFTFDSKKSSLKLTRVERNSPAWLAGLTAGDILVAINNMRVTPNDFNNLMGQFKPGEKITLNLFRNDQLISLALVLAERPDKPIKVKVMTDASNQQKKYFEAWLGVEFPQTDPPNN